MKRFLFVCSAVLLLATTLNAQTAFEGTISITPDFKNTPDAAPVLNMDVKGNRVVVIPQGKDATAARIIFDSKTKMVYMLTSENGTKSALQFSADDLMQLAQQNGHALPDTGKPTITVTKETRTIDGYVCTRVEFENSDATGEAWVTNAFALDMKDLIPVIKNKDISGNYTYMNSFPLELWGTNKTTGKSYSMKFHVERKTLDASEFQVPTDYTLTDMRTMMDVVQQNPDVKKMIDQMMGGQQ